MPELDRSQSEATGYSRPPSGRVGFVVAVGALLLTPPVASAFLVEQARTSDQTVIDVVLPAALGAAIGLIVVAAGWRRGMKNYRNRRREGVKNQNYDRSLGGVGVTLICVAAFLGTFSGHLPTSVQALMEGAAFGFLLTFDLLLIRLVRSDPEARRRLRLINPFATWR